MPRGAFGGAAEQIWSQPLTASLVADPELPTSGCGRQAQCAPFASARPVSPPAREPGHRPHGWRHAGGVPVAGPRGLRRRRHSRRSCADRRVVVERRGCDERAAEFVDERRPIAFRVEAWTTGRHPPRRHQARLGYGRVGFGAAERACRRPALAHRRGARVTEPESGALRRRSTTSWSSSSATTLLGWRKNSEKGRSTTRMSETISELLQKSTLLGRCPLDGVAVPQMSNSVGGSIRCEPGPIDGSTSASLSLPRRPSARLSGRRNAVVAAQARTLADGSPSARFIATSAPWSSASLDSAASRSVPDDLRLRVVRTLHDTSSADRHKLATWSGTPGDRCAPPRGRRRPHKLMSIDGP